MDLSPLRKQVQSLNKQLESQNVQIKDLIGFLNMSNSNDMLMKSKKLQSKSKISQLKCNQKNCAPLQNLKDQKKPYLINNSSKNTGLKRGKLQCKSMRQLKPLSPFLQNNQQPFYRQSSSHRLHQSVHNNISCSQAVLVKSIKFHNVKNATINRKYLKLSKPDRKTNVSCSFCRESMSGGILFNTDRSNTLNRQKSFKNIQLMKSIVSQIKEQIKQKHNCSFKKTLPSQNCNKNSKSKRKSQQIKSNQNSQKKKPLKTINSNEILLKNEIKFFIEKKSLGGTTKNIQNKLKSKLYIQDKQNTHKLIKKKQ